MRADRKLGKEQWTLSKNGYPNQQALLHVKKVWYGLPCKERKETRANFIHMEQSHLTRYHEGLLHDIARLEPSFPCHDACLWNHWLWQPYSLSGMMAIDLDFWIAEIIRREQR
jgi:hypothetical protein